MEGAPSPSPFLAGCRRPSSPVSVAVSSSSSRRSSLPWGNAFSLEAEFCSIRMGLKIAWNHGITSLLVEFNYKVAVCLILTGDPQFHLYGPLILDCRDNFSRQWNCSIFNIPRERNSCADLIAKWSHSYNGPILLTDTLGLGPLLTNDVVGLRGAHSPARPAKTAQSDPTRRHWVVSTDRVGG
ncbi:hypothetical protein L1049_000043 [Liquidambar formosana]|uniref:RNase H type-1 domain-containing protein n=1 Tax=Liquidambar formosana TaxID=63359 RepID=A0AAP0N6Y9_LIQFO